MVKKLRITANETIPTINPNFLYFPILIICCTSPSYKSTIRRDRKKLSLYYAQKRVSQISLLQTISFKETYHRSLLEF
ncbi:MAG: hypothetical protein DWQ58_14155 [Microcystis aeruginosa TA09]|nr:MAG: hypothetical protein DWQ58_14155 [Microcystis aeruginosa TA09]